MEKVWKVIESPDYQLYLQKNLEAEQNRIYCTHHFDHLLTVARLTYILLLESGEPFISREMAYAAGLLHDLGRWQEHESNTDHAESSAILAKPILEKAGFLEAENNIIIRAIKQHRLKEIGNKHRSPLSIALSRADSLSRLCFCCKTADGCNKIEKQPHRDRLLY
jgi:uncharacterized protein